MTEKILYNEQYIKFILDHIANPYSNMIGFERGFKKIVFNNGDEKDGAISYQRLTSKVIHNPEWFELVIDRLSRIYSTIDFSFFPHNSTLANKIKMNLIEKGVTFINQFVP